MVEQPSLKRSLWVRLPPCAPMEKTQKLIFLGGTVGKNNWREPFIERLVASGVSRDSIFNPVVKDWNEAARESEEKAKKEASHFLFYIANPYLEGSTLSAYSMVEATMALYDSPDTTVVVFDPTDIEGHSLKAFLQTEKVLRKRFPTAKIFGNTDEALNWLAAHLK